jgi:small subunit ribosomal protein S17
MPETKKPVAGQPPQAPNRRRNEKIGEVVSNRMAKTIVVQVTLHTSHALYKRSISKRHKFYAHDEQGQSHIGDIVRIVETRPMSRLKRWRLVEVIRKAAQMPSREEVVRAVGEAELSPDTRKPEPAEPAPAAE